MLIRAVNTAISAGWLILAVIAVRAVCRRAPRSMICLLWALAALRLVCPFSLQSPMSLIPSAEIIPETAVTEAEMETETAEPVALDIVDNHIYRELPAPEVHVEAARVRDWTPYGTILWLTGTAALLIYALVSWLKLRRQVAASVRVKGNIFICDWIASPFILGVLRPKIYLPSSMDREQFTYVLAHEHAHLKRGDHWWKPLGFLLLAVYWFQPLVWAAFILFCRDMELACDERVVRDMGMWERKVYSQILLSCSAAGHMASVCPVSFGGVGVKARIRSVLHFRRPATRAVVGMGAVAIVLAVCFLTDPQEGAAASAEASPAPSATPEVHSLTGEEAAARQGLNLGSQSELEADKAAAEESEESFAAMLKEKEASWGTPMTYEEYAERYAQDLVPLDNVPAGYENTGYVFVRADLGADIPGVTFDAEPLIDQVLYNYAERTAIIITQCNTSDPDSQPYFIYSDHDETGRPLSDYCWFSYQADYTGGTTGGKNIDMLMRSSREMVPKDCWLIFRSLWPEE